MGAGKPPSPARKRASAAATHQTASKVVRAITGKSLFKYEGELMNEVYLNRQKKAKAKKRKKN